MEEKKEPTINDIVIKFRQLQNEHNVLLERYLEICEDKREYELVTEAIKPLQQDRKCWRMVGGILIEKTVKLVQPELASQLENMMKVITSLEEAITRKSLELKSFEAK